MKTYKLDFAKANHISYSEIEEMRNAGDLTISCSQSQVIKRLTFDMFSDIMTDLQNGESVIIEG